MPKQRRMRFVEFVKDAIGKDELDIAAFFAGDIETMAAECRIDWHASLKRLVWDGTKQNSADGVKGLTEEDTGRTYIYAEVKEFEKDGDRFTYPVLTFKSYQNTYGMPGAKFNALGLLFDEYDKYKETLKKPAAKPRMSDEEKAAHLARIAEEDKATKEEQEAYLAAEPDRYKNMRELGSHQKVFSPYLQKKKVADVASNIGIRVGKNQNGYFTCFPLYNIWGELGGLQRIYHVKPKGWKKDKKTSWGFNNTGYFFVIGPALHSSEMAYLVEGLATGLAMFKATGRTVVVCLSANNLYQVSKVLAEHIPALKRVHVADNDKYKPKAGNTGVFTCSWAVRDFGGFVLVLKPSKGTDACDVNEHDGLQELKAQIRDESNYFNGRFSQHVEGEFNFLQAA